jgi:ornithine carbamoyltransferase
MKINTKHLLTGDELSDTDIHSLLDLAVELKKNRLAYKTTLNHKFLALLFEKPSLRTRFSFTIAMRELGGDVIESLGSTRKTEEPEDQIRVLQGYCHALMVRTFEDELLERMTSVSDIPIINGLSNLYHPCQTLADLMTLKEKFTALMGLSLCYLGDGNNVLHSLLLMAVKLGINIHYACPSDYGPDLQILEQCKKNATHSQIIAFDDPIAAVQDCHAIYTDTWTSMGFEPKDENVFKPLQVNEELMSHAHKDAIFMHCMPMNRGKEVSQSLPDQPCSAIFQQSENRLHVQKSLLLNLLT